MFMPKHKKVRFHNQHFLRKAHILLMYLEQLKLAANLADSYALKAQYFSKLALVVAYVIYALLFIAIQ